MSATPRPRGVRTVDLRLAIPAAVGWAATAITIGARGLSAPAASGAGTVGVVAVGIALAARRPRILRHPRRPRPPRRRASSTAVPRTRVAPTVAVAAAVAALLLGAAAAHEPSRHPAALDAAATSSAGATSGDGMVVVDVAVDEPPAPVRAEGRPAQDGGSEAGSDAGAGAGVGASAHGRVLIVGRVTALRVGRTVRGSRARDAAATAVVPLEPVPVVVFCAAAVRGEHRLGIGAVVRLTAAVKAAGPGDRAAYLLVARGPLERVAEPVGPIAVADGLRAGLVTAAADLPGPGARLLPGLAIGDVQAVPPELAQTMKDSSLTHLTAVSGANCAVIVGLVLALGGAAGLRRPGRAIAALVALAAFLVLVTPQPSVLRAAVMAAVLLLSAPVGRPSRGLPALALAVIVLLVGDPWLARDLGFALSVLATAGLLVLAPPLADRLARRMPRRLADALAIPIAAQVACQPVLLVLQPGLPVHGVLANLLAEPAAAPATIAGLVACALLPVWPWAGGLALRLAWLPASWIAAVAAVTTRLPLARIPWATGIGGVVALSAATALVVAVVALGRVPPDG